MIRVAISSENGFRLSDEAILLCVERGMTLAPYDEFRIPPGYDFFTWGDGRSEAVGQQYGTREDWTNRFRTNPIVLSVLEDLGERAMTPIYGDSPRTFKIIEIPFDSCEGWHIRSEEFGTGEYVCEDHRTWGYN